MNPILFIAIGGFVAVVIIIGLIAFCCKKSDDKKQNGKKSQVEIISKPLPEKEPDQTPNFYE